MVPNHSNNTDSMPSEEDEPLQAVVLADTYNERLKPLTVNYPRCLLPICNTTLLNWTLESLALAGVHEVFVVCTAHADLIKETLAASKYAAPSSTLKITPIVTSPACFAPGEALRDMYTHGVVTGDFVLVFGDLVSSVRLGAAVHAHRARRRTDKDALMTVVVKEARGECRSRPLGDTGVFVVDADTAELLHYEAVPGVPVKKSVRIPRGALARHRNVDVRNDLIDCGIDICSAEVLSLFQDNFDYLDIRRDFVHGVLASDLLAKTIHCHIVTDGYAARVRDTKSYAMISKDILARWTYPLVPDANNPSGEVYEHRRGNTYVSSDQSVTLSRSCKIGPNTLIGASSTVGPGAQIARSVLGRRCLVGAGAMVRDSYLWDDVRVEAGCVVEHCIVARGAVLRTGSVLARGGVVGDGVVLGPGARLPEFARVAREAPVRGAERRIDVLGPESNAVVWPELGAVNDGEEEDGLTDELETAQNLALLRIGDETRLVDIDRYEVYSSSSEEDEDEDEDEDGSVSGSGSEMAVSKGGRAGAAFEAQVSARAEAEFQGEAAASLERAWAEGHAVENAAVELKTLRMASNVGLRQVREAVVAFLVDKIAAGAGDSGVGVGVGSARGRVRKVMGRWGGLITGIGGVDGAETIEVLQRVCAGGEAAHEGLFGLVLAAMYEEDIVEEEDVRAWHGREANRGAGLERSWAVGTRMLAQIDAQDTESESE